MNHHVIPVAIENLKVESKFVLPIIEYHEVAMLFSRMGPESFQGLVRDIKANGLLEAIVLYKGKIIDGRHRYEACHLAGVTPHFVEFTGADPLKYVRSLNVHRRHLTESQAAVAVALDQDWDKALKHGGARKGPPQAGVTVADRAKLANVSERLQKTADALARVRSDLGAKVVAGAISLSDACVEAGLKGVQSHACKCTSCKEICIQIDELRKQRRACTKESVVAQQ